MTSTYALGSKDSKRSFSAFVVLPRHHSAAHRQRTEDGVPPHD